MHAAPGDRRATTTYVRASGMALPFADASVDICLSSNVAEHVRAAVATGREMLRVTKPGGLVVLSYTVWLGPFGGHETGLSHYLGGTRAADRYTRKHGHRAEERLRLVAVRGIGGRRPALGGEHRCAARRISPLPPAMGLVADGRAGAAGSSW